MRQEPGCSFAPYRICTFLGIALAYFGMNVVQGLYHDFKIAAFLMEQRISFNQKLGHLPEISDRVAFGGQLVRAMAGRLALTDSPKTTLAT